jgi:ubiquinone/menaquinone biosynthesis C-methylase UbiE
MTELSISVPGAKVYSPRLLAVYDWLVLGVNARLLWRCKPSELLELYNLRVSNEHLDVGVGSGFFLDRCRFPSQTPNVCLLDLNQNSLSFAATRIARYRPETHCGDVLAPLPFKEGRFGSVGMSALLHCLPGTMATKSVAFANVARCMAPGAPVFGCTVVNVPERMHFLARRVMRDLNHKAIFSNLDDRPEELERALAEHFDAVEVRLVGCVAIFEARARKMEEY